VARWPYVGDIRPAVSVWRCTGGSTRTRFHIPLIGRRATVIAKQPLDPKREDLRQHKSRFQSRAAGAGSHPPRKGDTVRLRNTHAHIVAPQPLLSGFPAPWWRADARPLFQHDRVLLRPRRGQPTWPLARPSCRRAHAAARARQHPAPRVGAPAPRRPDGGPQWHRGSGRAHSDQERLQPVRP
jgi:hypothetical protein